MKFADALRSCSAYLMAYTSCTGVIFCLLLCWSATRPRIFHSLYLQALFLDDLRPLADLVRNEGPGLGTAAAHHIEAIALEHLAQRRALHGFQRRRVQSIDHCCRRSRRCDQREPGQGPAAGERLGDGRHIGQRRHALRNGRASAPTPPPAANGTISRIGLSGESPPPGCARTACAEPCELKEPERHCAPSGRFHEGSFIRIIRIIRSSRPAIS